MIHEGKQPQVLGENITSDVTDNKSDFHQGYRNRFLATPWDAHYRPALSCRVVGPLIMGKDSEQVENEMLIKKIGMVLASVLLSGMALAAQLTSD